MHLRRGVVETARTVGTAVVNGSQDPATIAWVGANVDRLRISGTVVGLVLLWWLDLSWLGLLVLALLVGAYELVVHRLAEQATVTEDKDRPEVEPADAPALSNPPIRPVGAVPGPDLRGRTGLHQPAQLLGWAGYPAAVGLGPGEAEAVQEHAQGHGQADRGHDERDLLEARLRDQVEGEDARACADLPYAHDRITERTAEPVQHRRSRGGTRVTSGGWTASTSPLR